MSITKTPKNNNNRRERQKLLEHKLMFPVSEWNFTYKWEIESDTLTTLEVSDPQTNTNLKVNFNYGNTAVVVSISLRVNNFIQDYDYCGVKFGIEELMDSNIITHNLVPYINVFIEKNKELWLQ